MHQLVEGCTRAASEWGERSVGVVLNSRDAKAGSSKLLGMPESVDASHGLQCSSRLCVGDCAHRHTTTSHAQSAAHDCAVQSARAEAEAELSNPLRSRHYRPYAESDAAPHGAAAHSRSDRESDAALRPLVRLPGWPIALALRTAMAICAESIAKQTSEAKPSLRRWASHTALRCSTCAGRSLEVSARARCTRQRWYAAPSHPIPFRLGRPMVCAVPLGSFGWLVGCSVLRTGAAFADFEAKHFASRRCSLARGIPVGVRDSQRHY
jgi:hypothetical protein